MKEIERIFGTEQNMHSKGWRITKVNEKYEMCATYPRILVVPYSVSDSEIKKVAEFRSKGSKCYDLKIIFI